MSKSYTGGLNFEWPTADDNDWDPPVDEALDIISGHDHSGSGEGNPINTNGIAANAIDDTKIRLRNDQPLRMRNAAGSADVSLLKGDAADQLNLMRPTIASSTFRSIGATTLDTTLNVGGITTLSDTLNATAINASAGVILSSAFSLAGTETLTSSGAISTIVPGTILNGSSLAMTLANGLGSGQFKFIVNIASTNATVTPATTAGANTLILGQNGFALLVFYSGEWRTLAASNAHISDDSQSFSGAGTWNATSKLVICTGTTYTVTTPNGYEGQTVMVRNQASGNVTFGGQVMATGTYYLYSYLNAGWRRVALT